MTGVVHADLMWRKSSYSNGNQACLEFAEHSRGVAVRDSKDPDTTPVLDYGPGAWVAFLTVVR